MTSSEMVSETGSSRRMGVVVRRGDSDCAALLPPPPSSRTPSAHANTIIGLGEDFIDELRLTMPWIRSPLPPAASDALDDSACTPMPPLSATARCSTVPPAAAAISSAPSVTPPPASSTVSCAKRRREREDSTTSSLTAPSPRKPTAITLVSPEPNVQVAAVDTQDVEFGAQLRLHVRNIVRELGQLTVDVVDAVERWLRGRPAASC
ncbi:MAG: hypothetical protein R3B13_08255 [Polyangiaceae bacterium]